MGRTQSILFSLYFYTFKIALGFRLGMRSTDDGMMILVAAPSKWTAIRKTQHPNKNGVPSKLTTSVPGLRGLAE